MGLPGTSTEPWTSLLVLENLLFYTSKEEDLSIPRKHKWQRGNEYILQTQQAADSGTVFRGAPAETQSHLKQNNTFVLGHLSLPTVTTFCIDLDQNANLTFFPAQHLPRSGLSFHKALPPLMMGFPHVFSRRKPDWWPPFWKSSDSRVAPSISDKTWPDFTRCARNRSSLIPKKIKKLTWPFLPISPRKRITMWNFILTNLNLWATQEKDSFSLTTLSLAAALANKTTLATVSLGHVCAHWIFESRRSYLVSSTDVQWQMLCLPCLCFLRPILKALSKVKEAPRKSRYRYILFILEIIWIQQLHRQPPFQNQTLSRVSGHPYKEGLW